MVSPRRRRRALAAGLLVLCCLCTALAQKALPTAAKTTAQEDVFRILDTSTGEILTVEARDFLPGAVVTEMTLYAHEEALKAQAVACYTYYAWERAKHTNDAYDFTCNTKEWQAYVTPQEMQDRWGENYGAYMEILDRVTEAAAGYCLTQEGEPICATYFAISSGKTENSADVWGGELSYLSAVASPGDVYARGYQTSAAFSAQELADATGATLPAEGEEASWVQVLSRTASGAVTAVAIGDKTFTGGELRTALGLRSANFSVSYSAGQWTFLVKGWGHGVGMSQAGADYMARRGFSFDEILAWYYPGAELSRTANG